MGRMYERGGGCKTGIDQTRIRIIAKTSTTFSKYNTGKTFGEITLVRDDNASKQFRGRLLLPAGIWEKGLLEYERHDEWSGRGRRKQDERWGK